MKNVAYICHQRKTRFENAGLDSVGPFWRDAGGEDGVYGNCVAEPIDRDQRVRVQIHVYHVIRLVEWLHGW